MEVQDDTTKNVILVNRGWVPLQYVQQKKPWNRPTEIVDIVGIVSSTERKCTKPFTKSPYPLSFLFIYLFIVSFFIIIFLKPLSFENHINIIIHFIL